MTKQGFTPLEKKPLTKSEVYILAIGGLKPPTSNAFLTGFTFIEILIVITTTVILVAASIPIYGNLQVSSQLNESASQIIQTVRMSRQRGVARYNDAQHGVYFEINAGNDRFILYQGSTYAARDSSYDIATTLDSSLSLATTLTGNEINFSKELGVPNVTGAITLTHDTGGTRSIIINSFGMVEKN